MSARRGGGERKELGIDINNFKGAATAADRARVHNDFPFSPRSRALSPVRSSIHIGISKVRGVLLTYSFVAGRRDATTRAPRRTSRTTRAGRKVTMRERKKAWEDSDGLSAGREGLLYTGTLDEDKLTSLYALTGLVSVFLCPADIKLSGRALVLTIGFFREDVRVMMPSRCFKRSITRGKMCYAKMCTARAFHLGNIHGKALTWGKFLLARSTTSWRNEK